MTRLKLLKSSAAWLTGKDWSALLFSVRTGWVILIVSLILTALAWTLSARYLHQRAEARFNAKVARVEEAIMDRMSQYARVLEAGGAFYNGSTQVTRDDWHKFISNLHIFDHYPGTQGFGVSYPVLPQDMNAHLARFRLDGFEDYKIHPAGTREFYTGIAYLEPLDWRNRRAIGYDMYSEKNRRDAMNRAIETGKVSISSKVILKQETDKEVQSGFLMYFPVFKKPVWEGETLAERRANLRSIVYAVLRANDLMENVLGDLDDEATLSLYDEDFEDSSLLYQSVVAKKTDVSVIDGLRNAQFSVEKMLPIYGHRWFMVLSSRNSAQSRNDFWQSTLIGLGGLLVDIMLFVIIHQGARRGRTLQQEIYTKQLERSNDDLERFAHAAAHDLKSPLRAIDNLSGWIAKDNEAILPEESKRHLALLQSRSKRLERLLDDLLSYSRLDHEKAEPEKVPLEELVNEVIDMLSVPGSFEIKVSLPLPIIMTERAPLRQVLMNLVSNALKHHDRANGLVSIAGSWRDGLLECTVSDDGPGIAPEDRERVFRMFATLKSKDRQDTSGVGLAMVSKLVANHHGSISMEDNGLGVRGLRVRFTWLAPLAKDEIGSADSEYQVTVS